MPSNTHRAEQARAFGKIEIKKAADGATVEEGVVIGYGALFDVPHPTSSWALPMDWKDVIKPGAFMRSLGEHKQLGTLPAFCLQHDLYTPIGAWRSVVEDEKGLAVEGILATKTEDGSNTYELMKVGALRGLSIGLVARKFELDEKTKTRSLLDLDLPEISACTIQAVPGAVVSDVKAAGRASGLALGLQALLAAVEDFVEGKGNGAEVKAIAERLAEFGEAGKALPIDPHNIRDLEAVLREAGLSRSEAKGVLAHGFTSTTGARDATTLDLERIKALTMQFRTAAQQ